ncbi:MAG: hypothetical protein ACXAC7_06095 [Candidatus Hodarchaeales archaeon]
MNQDRHSGELSVELGQEPIAGEYYNFKAKKTSYGAQAVTYMCLNRLTSKYQLKKHEIYRTVREFIQPNSFKKLIEENGFNIKLFDDSSHSLIYGLSQD